MNPIVTLATGVVLGALGVHFGRKRRSGVAINEVAGASLTAVRGGLTRASAELKGAAITGLSAVEKSSGSLRQRLEGDSVAADEAVSFMRENEDAGL